jgi:hypothetical protein
MNSKLLLAYLSICSSGCYDIYSPSEIQRTVQETPGNRGLYIVDYKRHAVIDEFGPGVAAVREAVRQSATAEAKRDAWNQALAVAVPRYLAAKNIVPPICVDGVVVIDSGPVEGGGGWSRFRCKDARDPSN